VANPSSATHSPAEPRALSDLAELALDIGAALVAESDDDIPV